MLRTVFLSFIALTFLGCCNCTGDCCKKPAVESKSQQPVVVNQIPVIPEVKPEAEKKQDEPKKKDRHIRRNPK